MKKENYFNLVKKINAAVRTAGHSYWKCYSDKRKTNGKYRTKLNGATPSKTIANLINNHFGNQVVAKAISCTNGYGRQNSVAYRPLVEVTQN